MSVSVIEQNRALFHRWFNELWNRGNYSIADEVIDPSFTVHGAGGQVVRQGPDGVKELVRTWRTAFPDGHMTVDALLAEGDLVAALLVWRGTHLGTFYNLPASNKMIEIGSIGIDKVVNGKIVEGWGEVDMLGAMQQMGAISLPGLGVPTSTLKRQPIGEQAMAGGQGQQPVDNKAILLRLIQIFNEGNMDTVGEVIDIANYIEHHMGIGTMKFEDTRQAYTMIRQALPDIHFTPDLNLLIADGDRVTIHGEVTGTHTGGALFGVLPSGKRLDLTRADIVRIAGGKIVERWVCADNLRMMQQLGVIRQS